MKRVGMIDPDYVYGSIHCQADSRGDDPLSRWFICTLQPGHSGDHIGHFADGKIGHIWPNITADMRVPEGL